MLSLDHPEQKQALLQISEELCNAKIDSIELGGSGANSRIYKVVSGSTNFALKFYKEGKIFWNDRLNAETKALKLFQKNGFLNTPHFVRANLEKNCSLIEWIDGKTMKSDGMNKISEMCQFLKDVHILKNQVLKDNLPLGTEACLSGTELLRQLHMRIENLRKSEKTNSDFHKFLDNEFVQVVEKTANRCQHQYKDANMDFSQEISKAQQTLSVVDFGFHNMLQHLDGSITYIDFEYFGWDDPVKLVADTMQHPGINLDASARKLFFEKTLTIFGQDPEYLTRLKILYPLYGLRWCAIMLNEFLPGYKRISPKDFSIEEEQHLKLEKLNQVRINLKNIQTYKKFIY